METAEDYGASSQSTESPHQAFTSTLVHSSQTPNQQLPHPSSAHQTEQQYDQNRQHILDQHQQRQQLQDWSLQQQELLLATSCFIVSCVDACVRLSVRCE